MHRPLLPTRRISRRRLGPWRLVAAWAMFLGMTGAQAEGGDPASVKAAVLYNLMPFIAWPADVQQGDEFRLCLYDDNALFAAVRRFEGRSVVGRRLAVNRIAETADALRGCHAVMIEAGSPTRLARAALAAKEQALLVISEGRGAITRGAMIGIATDSGRVVFEIDLGTMRRARLNASSRLLSLAREVVQ